jgi:hypothetical protein
MISHATALMYACADGDVDAVRLLLLDQKGIDVNLPTTGLTALCFATAGEHPRAGGPLRPK